MGVVEEAEHALPEQCRGAFVVVGQAVVSEQVPIAGVQEQLRALDRLGELAGGVEIALSEDQLVGVHHVDLEPDAMGPRAAELGERDGGLDQ